MKIRFKLFESVALITLCGCGSSDPTVTKATPHVEHGEHVHPSEGPHGGSIIELGNEAYHAELVHDDTAKTVTIYLLDSAAKVSSPIDAVEVIINLNHDEQSEQFKVAASADANDPAGKSSRFLSTSADLAEDLDHEDAEAHLVVTIDGKQYRGEIHHDHEGHQH